MDPLHKRRAGAVARPDGSVAWRVWAPLHDRVELVLFDGDRRHPLAMAPEEYGSFPRVVDEIVDLFEMVELPCVWLHAVTAQPPSPDVRLPPAHGSAEHASSVAQETIDLRLRALCQGLCLACG